MGGTYSGEEGDDRDGVSPEEDIVELLPPETGREEPEHVHADHEDQAPGVLRAGDVR